MILAPLALALLATTPPEALTLLQKQNPAPAAVVTARLSLRDAAIDAARRSGPRLEQAPILRRAGPRSSPRPGRKAVAIGLGVLAGFVGGLAIGPAMSDGECMSPAWLWMSTTAGGGAAGWLLTRD